MDIAELLNAQRELQVEAYGVDPVSLTGEELGDYLTWNAFALTDELHELMAEVQWKPWANDRGAVSTGDRALVEFVDMLHFLANLALGFGFTAEEIGAAYRAKREVNRERQAQDGGYDAIESKCPSCHRDLLEVGRQVSQLNLDGITVTVESCAACGVQLSRRIG